MTYQKARTWRMQGAKEKGRHTKQEWFELKAFYNFRCVCCGRRENKTGYIMDWIWMEKDHVFPVSMGGCDCIGNIQPLCQSCNVKKGAKYADYREEAKDRYGLNGKS